MFPLQTCNGNLAQRQQNLYQRFQHQLLHGACCQHRSLSTLNQGITNYAVTRGNERRNNLRQPGINNWDMGLQKSFGLFGEGRELQFRADAFNAFNHTQWQSQSNTYDDRQTNSGKASLDRSREPVRVAACS